MRQLYKDLLSVALVGLSALWLRTGAFAADSAEAPAAPTKPAVLVLPFSALNPPEDQRWLGRSIQQSLIADLIAIAPGRVMSLELEASDNAAAIDAGRKAGARYVVRGDFATAGKDTRITGQVFDVETAKLVTAIKATGPSTNVFWLEDDLAAQIRRRLSLNPVAPPPPEMETNAPAMEPLRIPAQAPADAYVQAYVLPMEGSHVPAQITYDYYLSQPTGNCFSASCFGSVWPGTGGGFGASFYGGVCWPQWSAGRSGRFNSSHFGGSSSFRAAMAAVRQ